VFPCRAVAGVGGLFHLLEQLAVCSRIVSVLERYASWKYVPFSSARTARRTDSICCCETSASRLAISPFKRNLPGYGMSCETPRPR